MEFNIKALVKEIDKKLVKLGNEDQSIPYAVELLRIFDDTYVALKVTRTIKQHTGVDYDAKDKIIYRINENDEDTKSLGNDLGILIHDSYHGGIKYGTIQRVISHQPCLVDAFRY